MHGAEYVPRATMTVSDMVEDPEQEFDTLYGEISPGSRMVSFDVSAVQDHPYMAYIEVNYKKSVVEKGWDNINTFMWARGRTDSDYPYRMGCIQYHFRSFGSMREGSFASRGGSWVKKFQTFGTYVSLQ